MSSLNATPAADRVHIGIFGKRNAGKSSLINAVTGQSLAIVSETLGTTTDPVYKAMELLPLGPVMVIDTPGIDDDGQLGSLRVQRAYQVLNKTDIALLVIDATTGPGPEDIALLEKMLAKKLATLVVFNKSDLLEGRSIPNMEAVAKLQAPTLTVSSSQGLNIQELKEAIARLVPQGISEHPICSDLVEPKDFVVLVVPVDSAAPKGRLILPQQQTIRDILDAGAVALVTKETELAETLARLGTKPKLVITDSQAFGLVNKITPQELLLTSFSILFARHKGNLAIAVEGVTALKTLQDGDRVLISEGCTHHRQCDDIGTVKMPRWVEEFTGKRLTYEWTSGGEFPLDLSPYRLIIHCGGCMLNEREMRYRYKYAQDQQVPITNYGIAIAYMHGILKRSLSVFPELAEKL